MKAKKRIVVCLLFVLLTCGITPMLQKAEAAEGAQQFAEFGDFKLRNGEVIHEFRLGYRTLGTLNAEKSNAILWPTWLGGKSEDLLRYGGPGNVVETGNYFVIFVDAIGDGVSSSPSNSAKQPLMKFPKFTIRDMVEAEYRLVTEVFHIAHLHAVMGISMGGMQAFEWVVAHPEFVDLGIPIAGSPQSTSYDKLFWTAQIDAIELDPAWNHGHPTGPLNRGLPLSEEIGSMNSTSPDYRVQHTSPGEFDTFLTEIREGAKGDGGTASNQIRQREAIMSLDVAGEFAVTLAEAAKRVHAKLLVVVSPEDHTVNPTPAMEFAAAIGAPVVKLESPCGHQSPSCVSLGPMVARFLADPSTGRSETLRDPHKQ